MLDIFKNINGESILNTYSNEDALKLLYAIGWYNNFLISDKYILNKCINDVSESPAYHYYKNELAAGINLDTLNARSMHTKSIEETEITNKQLLVTIYELAALIKNYNGGKAAFIVNEFLAKRLINDDAKYNSLNIDKFKESGEAVIELGTVGEYKVYINLLSNEDDTRIFAYNTSNLIGQYQMLTSYIKY